MDDLKFIAQKIVDGGKGILAADESDNSIKKRFDTISLQSTPDTHRAYRDLLFTTAGIEQYIGGVIMFDETIRQRTMGGVPFPEVLSQKGIVTGIKVDKGTVDFTNYPNEKITEGLDGLGTRLTEYKSLGAQFAKWRAVITIGDKIPSPTVIDTNNMLLARYAVLCQAAGIVPIVEPEVLMDGTHTIDRCREVTYQVLKNLFSRLSEYKVDFSGMILKPNMVISGKECPDQAPSVKVAELTVKVFAEVLPDELPAVAFLSGGQTPEQATTNLNEINKFAQMKWRLTYSYGRALQEPVLKTWAGKDENREEAQKAFLKRAKLNSLASQGHYDPAMEKEA